MTTQPPDRLFRPVSPAAQAKGERVFCAAVALLLVLSEVFSSNIQNTLPTFSHVCRIALTVTVAVLLVADQTTGADGCRVGRFCGVYHRIRTRPMVFVCRFAWHWCQGCRFAPGAAGLPCRSGWRAAGGAAAARRNAAGALPVLLPQLGLRLWPLQRVRCPAGRCVFCLGLAALVAPALVGLGRLGCPGSLHAAGARLPRGRHCHGTGAGFVFAAACLARLF